VGYKEMSLGYSVQ